jgi:hypothetical protein
LAARTIGESFGSSATVLINGGAVPSATGAGSGALAAVVVEDCALT